MKGEGSEMHAYFAVETAIFGSPEVLGRLWELRGVSGSPPIFVTRKAK